MKRTYASDAMYGNNSSKRFKSSKTAKPWRRARKVPPPTRSAIQKAISAARETKVCYQRLSEASLNTIGSSGVFPYSLPVPVQGATSTERIGNRINPIRLEYRYVIHNNSAQTVYIRVLLLRVRQGNAVLDSTIQNELFDGTGGLDVAMAGNLTDLIAPINTAEYVPMHDEIVTLGYDAAGYSSPNSRVHHGRIIGKPLSTMVFEDKDSHHPTNDRYVALLIARRADSDEASGETFEFSYDARMYYKD